MPSFSGAAPYELRQRYETLVTKLEEAATNSDCGPILGTGRFALTGANTYVFDGYLRLTNWRVRPSSTKDRLEILIHVQETIRGPKPAYRLEKSTVRVGYFNIIDLNAHLLHAVHFDYGPAQIAHPIFHAQVCNEPVALGDSAQELEFEYEQIPCAPLQRYARIPTSDMSLPSVLICLAADHIQPELFEEFLKEVREVQKAMPLSAFARTQGSLQLEPTHLRSSHWFAHTAGY